ncbi:outer membrane protein assembly factor BamA [Gemmatimonadota bacterium]
MRVATDTPLRIRLRALPSLGALALALALPMVPGAGRLQAQGDPAQAGVPLVLVDSIEVVGNRRLVVPTIVGTLGFQAGSQVTYREIQKGIKNLFSTGQFSDVVIRARGAPGEPVILIVEVTEQDVVQRITIAGLEHVNERTVRDTTGLRTGLPYSPARVVAAMDYIRTELSKEGIPFARIDEQREELEDRPGEIHLILDVTEGNRVTLAQLEILGNEAVSDDEIRGSMETKTEGFLWFQDGAFNGELLTQDLDGSIPELFRAKGYLDFQVLSDTLIIDPQTGKTRLEIAVDEGDQYRLAEFSVEGNNHLTDEQVRSFFRQERGGLLRTLGIGGRNPSDEGYFDALAFEESVLRLQQAYNDEGYLYAEVQPWIERVDVAEGEEPTVNVGWRIHEDNPAYIRRITIVGNDFTHERVIRERINILPGDVYSQARLIQAYQGIGALGFFQAPMPLPEILPDELTGDVDITFLVEEQTTGAVNFGTAVGGGTGVSGFIGYDQPNLFGQAKEGHLRWDFGRYINSFTLSFSDPSLFQSRVSGMISLFNSRDRFYQFSTGRRKRIGFSTRFGLPIPWSLRSQVFFGYSLARTEYRQYQDTEDNSLFGIAPGTQSTFSLGITRNNLNHPIFPTMGSRQNWNTEFNGGILGGDGNFIRHLADASWYVPVGQLGGGSPGAQPLAFTLGITARAGAVFGDVSRFPFDRFWMGGVQFGQQLRGYDETSITPSGYFSERSQGLSDISRLGNAYFSATTELAARVGNNLSVAAFLDVGNLWADPRDMDIGQLYRGAGLGVQLVTPFGPIGLDYAYGFDKTKPGWQLHFRMGPGF